MIPPKDKETTITADHHVTKYVARVPEDATEDQMAKVVAKLREKLAPKQALLLPWYEVGVDLIGPWRIIINGIKIIFKALTIINPATDLTA